MTLAWLVRQTARILELDAAPLTNRLQSSVCAWTIGFA